MINISYLDIKSYKKLDKKLKIIYNLQVSVNKNVTDRENMLINVNKGCVLKLIFKQKRKDLVIN